MSRPDLGQDPLPARFADIKKEIAESYPDFEVHATQTWKEVLGELEKATAEIASQGPNIVPQVRLADLETLDQDIVEEIRRKGCVVIRDVVDDAEAASWQATLKEYVTVNPDIPGFPENDKQFFQLYWTGPQVRARAHPGVLAATTWLNKMYHADSDGSLDVDVSTPLSYADRFRMRHPGVQWDAHPPHIDSGSIERWEDKAFRKCFADILNGNWRQHDPYDLEARMNARSSLYGRENQASIFRTYQGWLAMSETAPREGTLKLFPQVLLSNAYVILRPFFRPSAPGLSDEALLNADNWVYDASSSDFPGIYNNTNGVGYRGPMPKPETHPHLKLEETMVSVPKVYPGDMVFWHSDLIHAVEQEHTGKADSSVMYIPAMPYTPQNAAYVTKQKEHFLQGLPPPDFPKWKGEAGFIGIGRPDDLTNPVGRRAMGFAVEVA